MNTRILFSYYTLLLLLPTFLSKICDAQNAVWVVMEQGVNDLKSGDEPFLRNYPKLNRTLADHEATAFRRSFPYSKNDFLRSVYTVEFKGDINEIERGLLTNMGSGVKQVIRIPEYELVELYDPSDHLWVEDWLWHLRNIEANLAWDITKGSANVTIAILDTWFDINHPDLAQKMITNNDPFSNTAFSSDCSRNHHGTTVAGFAAAHTDGGGQLASVGFNTMIIPYQAQAGNYLERAHHASLAMNADILTSSAGGWRCSNTQNEVERIAVQEILNNGTIIVMPAGNGIRISADGLVTINTRCRPAGENMDRPWFPLSPLYDNRIIIVTSTDRNDNHTFIEGGSTLIHSHFPEVDICAPGYRMVGATSTRMMEGGVCVANPWPYSGWATGTSFATPIVAGVCALMKSVNPCLTPAQAQSILRATADPIADAHLYPGMLGAGRVNAHKAVMRAGTRHISYTTLTGNRTLRAGYIFEVGNASVGANSNITMRSRGGVSIGPFDVPLGSSFTVIIDPHAVSDCN